MSIILAIKRSQQANTPAALANGELAYSFRSNKLFIGQTDDSGSPVTVEYIGGKLLVDKVANLEAIVFGEQGVQQEILSANTVVAGTLQVTDFTENGVMFAKANGIIDFVTGTTGKILQIDVNGTPVFDDLNGGEY